MKKVKRVLAILSLLGDGSKSSQETRKALIVSEGTWLVKFLSEIAMNILSGSVTLSKHYKKLLSHHAAVIRGLGKRGGQAITERRHLCIANIDVVSLMITAAQEHIVPLIESNPHFAG